MKEKIIIFLGGLLLGSIIATSAIYVYTIAQNNSNSTMSAPNMQNNNDNNNFGNGETPPEKPGNNTETN